MKMRDGTSAHLRLFGVLLLSSCIAIACASPWSRSSGGRRPPDAATRQRAQIVVVKSSDNPLFRLPISLFSAQVHADVHELTMNDGEPAKELLRRIDEIAPRLVVVLGAKALLLAKKHIFETPVLFAMVLNHRRFDLQGRPNFMGIELETPTMTEFTQFKMIVPGLRRVLALYGDEATRTLIDVARRDLAELSVELVAVPVEDVRDLERAYRDVSPKPDGDGLWLLNDSVSMARPGFEFLKTRSLEDRLPLMCSLSDSFTKEGALMSVSVDFRNLGSQAALMASRLIDRGESAAKIGVQSAMGGRLVVNVATAAKIGLAIDDEIVPFINELVGQ